VTVALHSGIKDRKRKWYTLFFINVARHISVTLRNLTVEILDSNSCITLQPTQQFGKCAFSICSLKIWNQISPFIRNIESILAVCKALKTCLFTFL